MMQEFTDFPSESNQQYSLEEFENAEEFNQSHKEHRADNRYYDIDATDLAEIKDSFGVKQTTVSVKTFHGSASSFRSSLVTQGAVAMVASTTLIGAAVMPEGSPLNIMTVLAKHSHSSNNWIVQEATCTENGYRYQICDDCDEQFNYETLYASGHQCDEETIVEATCTEEGNRYCICEKCGEIYNLTVIEKISHEFGDCQIAKEPSCIEEGLEEARCLHCDEIISRVIPMTDCVESDKFVVDIVPTCTEDGIGHTVCSVCGKTLRSSIALPATGHIMHKEVIQTKDCTHSEQIRHYCENCEYSYIEENPALGHNGMTTRQGDCVSGIEDVTICRRCNTILHEETVKEPSIHDFYCKQVVTIHEDDSTSVELFIYCRDCSFEENCNEGGQYSYVLGQRYPDEYEGCVVYYYKDIKVYDDSQTIFALTDIDRYIIEYIDERG